MSAEPKPQGGAVAVIAPPRLPYHPAIQERFGVDRSMWKALVEATFPLAKTTDAVVLALSYCKARKLDVFKRMVHIVPIYDAARGTEVETVWPGIAEHRTTAMRTGLYAGMDPPRFGPDKTQKFEGITGKGQYQKKVSAEVTFPEWCEITLYRMVQGERVPFPGPRVRWLEYFIARGKSGVPNDRWCRAPTQMLEKCAEAAALRRAFPEEIGDEWTAEEIGGAANMPMRDITPGADQPEPTRGQFTEGEQQQQHQARTTDVNEGGAEESGDREAAQGQGDQGADTQASTANQQPQSEGQAAAAAAEEPGWPLYSEHGDETGEYDPEPWIKAFDKGRPKAKPGQKQYDENNLETAKKIAADPNTSDDVKKQLGDRFGPSLW